LSQIVTARHRLPAALQEHEKVRWEEQRKAMQQDSQQKAQLAQYQDELARKRMETEHEKQRQRNAELVSMQVRAASWGPRNGVQRTTTSTC
jgi:hypothetical protein